MLVRTRSDSCAFLRSHVSNNTNEGDVKDATSLQEYESFIDDMIEASAIIEDPKAFHEAVTVVEEKEETA